MDPLEKASQAAASSTNRGSTETEPLPPPAPPPPPPPVEFKRGLKFYAILVAIAFTGLLTAMEATITSTALPSIIADLGGGDLYIWAVNGYLLAMTALQPLFGQLANVFGRRWPTILATASFTLGSGICAGATNMSMLIAGRVIQGVGAGGIGVLVEIIVCDIIPLRERGTYLAMVFGGIALGTGLGPFFGGLIVKNTTWRWVFWINLPFGAVAILLLVVFLHVNYEKEKSLATRVGSIDWLGNVIFVAAISAVLIALSWAGAVYPWSSYQVLVPLLVGMAGLGGFLVFEGSRFCPQPTMPLRLFANRTSAAALVLTFLHSLTALWSLYFLPVYFQGALGADPQQAGIDLLPTILVIIPFAIMAMRMQSKTGRYRPIHHAGFALMAISFGLFSLLDENSSTGTWVGFQMIGAAGSGLIIPTLLPAVLAPLTEADTALATATWAFLRSLGQVWGTAIGAAAFNTRFDELAWRIADPAVRANVTDGKAYQFSTAAFIDLLAPDTRAQFVGIVGESLQRSWQIAIAFAVAGFLFVAFEKEIVLRQELETEFGIAATTTADKSGGAEDPRQTDEELEKGLKKEVVGTTTTEAGDGR